MSSFLYEYSEVELVRAFEEPWNLRGGSNVFYQRTISSSTVSSTDDNGNIITSMRTIYPEDLDDSNETAPVSERRPSLRIKPFSEPLPGRRFSSGSKDAPTAKPEDIVTKSASIPPSMNVAAPIPSVASVDDRKLLKAGNTTQMAPEEAKICCSWSDGDATEFKVRTGPNYAKNGKKALSKPSLYHQIGMDVFKNTYDNETKICDIGHHVSLPPSSIPEYSRQQCPLPRIVIVNIQIPLTGPKLLKSSDSDQGVSVVQYFELKREVYEAALELETAPNHIKLLATFFKEAGRNDEYSRRFKVTGLIPNMVEVGVPSMLQSYNGKPAIIHKSGQIYRGLVNGNPNDEYFEMDIKVHDFGYVPRRAIHSMLGRVPTMKLRCGYVVQGEEDDQLPEVVFACSAMHNLDLSKAVPVDIHPPNQTKIVKRFTIQ